MPIHDIEIEKKALAKEYKELLMISYQSLSKDDKKLIRKAFDYAVDAHPVSYTHLTLPTTVSV